MSGRLTILPKKTYCPWKPENIERVLRDERLERERLENEAKRETEAAAAATAEHQRKGSRRSGIDDDDDDDRVGGVSNNNAEGANNYGHINLFPEAKEAELRLARGDNDNNRGSTIANDNGMKQCDTSGVLPIPLGGDEATKRKAGGSVPFYMRHTTTASSSADDNKDGGVIKYDNTNNSFRLGNNTNHQGRGGRTATVDEITTKIMKDQFAKREDYRKNQMDPMCRFYVDKPSTYSAPTTRGGGMYANEKTQPARGPAYDDNDMDKEKRKRRTDNNDGVIREKKHQSKHSKKRRRRKRASKSYNSESSDDSSNMSSTSSSSSDERYTRKKKSRRKKKHRNESKRRSRRDYTIDDATNDQGNLQQKHIDIIEKDELRKKRHAREMKERNIIMMKRGH